ncbi:MAG: hypothetical protein ABWJ90_06195 [Thermus sp.]|uniref:hypothetical protein n=1 Tax=Thermus sp. TaxID=275 RepID=UPI00351B892C
MTERALFLLLFLLALFPRGLLLGERPPFWFDEDWTFEVGTAPLGEAWQKLVEEDFHPPLSYLLLGLWARLLGLFGVENEVPLRLLPALLGSLVGPVLFLALRERGLPPPFAFLGGSLWAFLPQALLQDVEFRMYPLAALLVALSLLGAARGSFRLWALWVGLALYTHYLAGTVALSLGLRFGIRRALLPLLAFLPWLPAVAHQASKVHQLYHWNQDPYARLKEMLLLLYGAPDPLFLPLGALFWGLALLGLLLERQALLPFVLAVGLLFALGFQPISPRYLPVLLPVLVYGAGVAAWRLRLPGAVLLLALNLSWWALLPWTALMRLATSWPGLLP